MADVKNKKEYEKALAALIKEKKPMGQVVYDELTNRLATPFELGAEAMDQLIQKVEDAGVSVVDENGEPSKASLKQNEKNCESRAKRRFIGPNWCQNQRPSSYVFEGNRTRFAVDR